MPTFGARKAIITQGTDTTACALFQEDPPTLPWSSDPWLSGSISCGQCSCPLFLLVTVSPPYMWLLRLALKNTAAPDRQLAVSWLPPQQVAVPFKGDLSPSTSNTEVTYGGEPAGQAVHLGSSSPFPSLPCASVSSLTPFFFAFHSIFFLLAFLQVSLASASHLLSPPAALLSHFLSLTTASVNLHNLPPSTVAWTGWG